MPAINAQRRNTSTRATIMVTVIDIWGFWVNHAFTALIVFPG
jgi:hypothetical protein